MSLPKSKQKKLWNLWPIIQDIYPVLFILFSISSEFLELKFIRKTMLPKKTRFRFYRFNRTVKQQQKQCKKLPSKFVRSKSVLSQWMADVLEIRALHMLLSQAHTLSSHVHPNQILNHFLNDRIDVESVFIVELLWRKDNIRRRYFLICHLVLKKYEKNTDVEDKVACNQRTYHFSSLWCFLFHGSISIEMKTMFFEYFSHISHLRHVFKNVPKLNSRTFFVYCCSCSHFACWKINFFLQLCKTHSIWEFYYDLSRHIVFNIYHKIMGVNLDVCLLNKVAFWVFLCKNDGDSNNFKVHLFQFIHTLIQTHILFYSSSMNPMELNDFNNVVFFLFSVLLNAM